MPGVMEVAEQLRKDYGAGAATKGDVITEAPRIPTGIFPLDLALGGGIPEGRVTELFGAEGSCKTNILLKTLASKQRMNPDMKNVLLDIENTFDPLWAKRLGLNPADLLISKPDFGEQAVDMVEAFLNAPDVGIVGMDSLAAMITTREADNSAEKEDPGGSARVGKKLINKVTLALRAAEREGRSPTFIYINQTRFKIGVLYGDPTTTPGGMTPKFACSLRLQTFAKPIVDKKISTTHPIAKEIRVVVKKHKVPIVCQECIFEMVMIPHKGLKPGDVDYWKTLWHYLNLHGIVTNTDKKEWVFQGEGHKTQKAIYEKISADAELADMLKATIIKAEVERAYNEDHKAD